jgi:asparagine synthetase B (glutamine-hydrolysing)
MAHDLLDPSEPIDLLNVAFENPRIHKTAGNGAYELCPDRITGRNSYAELCEVCPNRDWRFITIDVPYAEFQTHRQKVITLMYPHETEMDLSIAAALYFAARGVGNVESKATKFPYTTSARVLLSGLGADELFAGYTRHATAFKRHGFEGLLDELDLDLSRLGKRNLGRDDRVISHFGREPRFPFLDEALIAWALATPVTDKCDFGASDEARNGEETDGCISIEPGKKVLRCLAWKLGMQRVAKEKKRAVSLTMTMPIRMAVDPTQIQFGARTAKMESGRSKGTTPLSQGIDQS